jgi:Protein of unknown function (Ytp1)
LYQGHLASPSPWTISIWDFRAVPDFRWFRSIDAWDRNIYGRLPWELFEWLSCSFHQWVHSLFQVSLFTHSCCGTEGGIFWCYGLVTFARFLGSFSEYGWAWNCSPTGQYVSAEFVESFVIFLYGITNTWMERFGAHPGDPYTTKQIQHISIAVMFWFAGLVGMGLECHRLRRWLAALSTTSLNGSNPSSDAITEPASYRGGFNPFPALVIGVTGAAMSAHFQTYLFQVSTAHTFVSEHVLK